jgi:hypothetical protein
MDTRSTNTDQGGCMITQQDDEFAKAIARKLVSRGIAKVPGLTDGSDDGSEDDSVSARLKRYTEAVQRQQPEQDDPSSQQTTASIFRAVIAGTSAPVPLNGMGVLRAAVSGLGTGTINGATEA